MQDSRRLFLKQFASVVSVLVGGSQLAGCLGDSDDSQQSATQSSSAPAAAAPTSQPAPAAPTQGTSSSGPVWQSSPTIEFVEGVPAVVPLRNFVQDADVDQLVITMNSGALLPGITFNPSNATLAYDGRPLGAKPGEPVVVSGVTFAADDRKN